VTNSKPLKELMSLHGRVALVTGGAGHVGSVIADGLAELGATLVIADLDEGVSSATAAAISRRWGGKAKGCAVDLEKGDHAAALPGCVSKEFGRLDILVNCAALVGTNDLKGWSVPLEQQSAETWHRAMEVNLTAPFLLAQSATTLLRTSGHGSIINVASIYGITGPDWRLYEGTKLGNPAAYAASKGGLVQLTRWLATTLAPDIRVNAIAPGGIERSTPEPFLSRYKERTPLGRMAREDDIKGSVAFLASDLSSYVTGQCLAIDGGWTAW
jgi:NAD(P)-dependent dehydrogenase (short-subunit alcohol dehydrogenase family)